METYKTNIYYELVGNRYYVNLLKNANKERESLAEYTIYNHITTDCMYVIIKT